MLAVPSPGTSTSTCRASSDRTGLTVWAHSGEVTLSSDHGVSTVDTVRRTGAPEGDWTASEPGLAPDPDDEVPDWYHQVATCPIVSALTGKQIGRASHHAGEWATDFEDDDRHLDRMTTYVHYYPATGRISAEHELPRPGAETAAYRLDVHGSPGRLHLAMRTAPSGRSTSGRPGRGSGDARACRACRRTTGSTSWSAGAAPPETAPSPCHRTRRATPTPARSSRTR
ncbi:hypothetical protein ACFQV4_30540 [Streptomyces thermocarboxydus]